MESIAAGQDKRPAICSSSDTSIKSKSTYLPGGHKNVVVLKALRFDYQH